MSNGRKVIIAIANTLESAFDNMKKDFMNDIPYDIGDVVENDFNSYCLYLLNYSFRYTEEKTIVDSEGREEVVKETKSIKDRSSDFERAVYDDIEMSYLSSYNYIFEHKVGVPISPIDNIKYLIKNSKGDFKIEEITGRKRCLVFQSEDLSKGVLDKRKRKKVSEIVTDFNSNKIDCLILNQSGAVGLSMHALPTKNQEGNIIPPVDVVTNEPPTNLRPNNEVKQRCMIITQSELDINKEVQKLGRINRTGQVFSPIFVYLISTIPSEKRLSSLMQKKLKSLSANVTGSQEQFNDLFESEDLFSTVAVEPFNETLDVMAYPYPKATNGNNIREFTKMLYFMNYEIQKRFYDTFTNIFNKKIQELIDKGLYSNMGIIKNYDAVVKNTYPFIIGNNDAYSSFGSHTYLTKSDCMVYESKILESKIKVELESGHDINFDGETLILKKDKYISWAEKYKVEYLKFKRDDYDSSIKWTLQAKDAFEKELDTLNEDAKRFEDLPKAIEIKEKIADNDVKLAELNSNIILLIGEGNMEKVNLLAREVQSIKSENDELNKQFQEKNFESIYSRQSEHDKILKRIIRLKEYIGEKDIDVLEYEERYKTDVEIAEMYLTYVKSIGNIFDFEKQQEDYHYDDNGDRKYTYSVMQEKQKVVLYDVKIDTKNVFDNLTLGKIHLKYFYVTGTDNFSLYQSNAPLSKEEKAEGRKNAISFIDTNINYLNNWDDYVAKINTGRIAEKFILNGNLLKAYSVLSSGNVLGSIIKYTLNDKKVLTGIELNKEEQERKEKDINNGIYSIYFDLNELNYEKLIQNWMEKTGNNAIANQILNDKGNIFLITEKNSYGDIYVHISMDKKPIAEAFVRIMNVGSIEYIIKNYTGKEIEILGESYPNENAYYKEWIYKLNRSNYKNNDDIFISNIMAQNEYNRGAQIIEKSINVRITLDGFKNFIYELSKEKVTLMSITTNNVVESANFYVFQDNSSNIGSVTVRSNEEANLKEPISEEVEKTLDDLINELVEILK